MLKKLIILGNGPGLNNVDFRRVHASGVPVLGMNRISELFNKGSEWPLSYYLNVTDNTVNIKSWEQSARIAINATPVSILSREVASHLQLSEPENSQIIDVDFGGHARRYNDVNPASIVWRQSGPYDKYGSSAHVAFQWASRKQFTKIYLLGFDLNFREQPFVTRVLRRLNVNYFFNDKNHFSSTYGTPGLKAKDLNRNMLSMHAISMLNFSRLGIDVVKVDTGGDLTLYKWQELEDFYEEISC